MGVMRGPLSWFGNITAAPERVRAPSSVCWLTPLAIEALAAPIDLHAVETGEVVASVATLDEALTAAKKAERPVKFVKRGVVIGVSVAEGEI